MRHAHSRALPFFIFLISDFVLLYLCSFHIHAATLGIFAAGGGKVRRSKLAFRTLNQKTQKYGLEQTSWKHFCRRGRQLLEPQPTSKVLLH